MSSFEVDTVHIDVLVSAALAAGTPGDPFSWYHRPADVPRAERGEMLPGMNGGERYAAYLAYLRENKREVTRENAGMWGALLVDANKRSVNYRYDADEIEDPYLFTRYAGPFSPVAILRALDCFEYQSCDDPSWRTSEAAEFCEALRRAMIRQLPGYSEAAYEVTDAAQVTVNGTARKVR